MVRATIILAALLIPGVVVGQITIPTTAGPDGRTMIITATQAPGGATGTVTRPVQGGVIPNGAPVRDPQQTPATGTSVIRGHVVDASNNTPLRKAVVTIFGVEIRESRSAATDPEGRYEFTDLPAGQYNINVTKPGYINVSYGQLAPNEAGKPLHLADKQTADKIDFSLPHGAVITGRVLDEYGEPVPDVMVSVLRTQYTPNGPRPLAGGRPSQTNDIGEFRIFGLAPGQYVLSATYRTMAGPANTTDTSGYAPTYYPGTANIADAIKLPVGMGGMISDVTLILVPTRTARITGTVFDAQGRPVRQGSVLLMARTVTMAMTSAGGQIRPDGSFTINGVSPGEYIVRGMIPNQSGMAAEGATANVTVNGIDVTDVRVEPVKPITVRGRVVMDAAAARSFKPDTMRISSGPSDPGPMFGPPSPPVAIKDDYTFEFKANPGAAIVRATSTLPGNTWLVKAITLNGADVTDGITFHNEDVTGLEIELTNRVPDVSGLVTDAKGDSITDYFAIAFPQDQERWTSPGIGRTAMVRPDDQGRFRFRTLRPGSYYVVAVDHVETGEWMDPAFMESMHVRGTRITVNEGDTQTIDLKLVRRNEPR